MNYIKFLKIKPRLNITNREDSIGWGFIIVEMNKWKENVFIGLFYSFQLIHKIEYGTAWLNVTKQEESVKWGFIIVEMNKWKENIYIGLYASFHRYTNLEQVANIKKILKTFVV